VGGSVATGLLKLKSIKIPEQRINTQIKDRAMLDARFSQLYFGPSLNTLQSGLPVIAGLLVTVKTTLL